MKRPMFGGSVAPARDDGSRNYGVLHLCTNEFITRAWGLVTAERTAREENGYQGQPEVGPYCPKNDDCLGFVAWRCATGGGGT